MNLHGIFPPVTTPFASDGSVALERLRQNLARYNRVGLAGYVINGSTSESVLLRWEEVYRVWETAKEAAAPGKTMIAGTGAESTPETIEHTNRAASFGYDAALVRTPSFYLPVMTENALAEHYLRVADAARIPILIYSVPVFTQLQVEAPLVARLAQHPNIIGMKDSSGDVPGVAKIIAAVPRTFRTLVGSAATLYQSLEVGAIGAILALACPFPELCVEIYEASRAGDSARAKTLAQKLIAPAKMLGVQYGIAGLKYAMDRLGYCGGPPRGPLLPVDEVAKREIDVMLTGMVSESAARS
ncbi:MAG TPA: dihydrodipicolinate synthase family protein [Candidatus Limnocylindria bacterium]|nr:dihydrodipicolinate synthase family protein [Candidatus Limnocylindria bacterium]